MQEPGASSVGRDEELRVLRRWLDASRDAGGVLVLEGEAGAGKTHLLEVVGAGAAAQGTRIHWLRAHPNFGAAPFFLWRSVLPAPQPSDDGSSAAGSAKRAALFDAVAAALAPAGQEPPLVLVDDVHWADADSLDLLLFLARELRRHPARLLLAGRPPAEEPSPWSAACRDLHREPQVRSLRVGGLDLEPTAELFARVSGGALEGDAVADVHAVTGGNPLFVRELASAARPGTGPALPSSVADAVGRRIDRLDDGAVEIVAAAAVIGHDVEPGLVADVAERAPSDVRSALDAAARERLVRRSSDGRWRFTHALVHEACRRRAGATAASAVHGRAAGALEAAGAPAAEIAWHHLCSAAPRSTAAAGWADRAGQDALAALAFDDAATWFARAATCDGESAAVVVRLTAEASAWALAGRRPRCRAAVDAAVERAIACGRVDLAATAALIPEPIGVLDWDLWIADRCTALLAAGTCEDDARACLHARHAEAMLYSGDHDAAERAAEAALAAADRCGTPAAVVAALRARQLVLAGPEHHDERVALADRMLATGTALRRTDLEAWGRLWKIDACWERSDPVGAAAEIPRLRWCAERSGDPRFRWHLLVAQACVEAAHGRFEEALATAREAFELGDRLGVAAALGAYMNLLGAVGHHIGHGAAMATTPEPLEGQEPTDEGQVRDRLFSFLGPAVAQAEDGRHAEALALFLRTGPLATWRPPPYLRVVAWANGAQAAVALGLHDAVAVLRRRLQDERGRTVVAGAGVAAYAGPVELYLGHTAAALGELDTAVVELGEALDIVGPVGIVGYEAEACIALAEVLHRRGRPSDAAAATELVGRGLPLARRHGMVPWARRAEQLQASLTSREDPLTQREREVAALVAAGRTNREIAEQLFISERTAQTHVQHILTKLGFTRRAQIAAWVSAGS